MTLKIVYIFFVAILTAVFVGVGIEAFYPAPEPPEMSTPLKVYRMPADATADPEILDELTVEQEKYDAEFETYRHKEELHNRDVSIIALVSAIIILVLSLVFSQRLLVIADGLLLGGVFTLLYSVARVFGSGDDKLRFYVVSVGLAVAFALGYLKFIKTSISKTHGKNKKTL